MTDDRGYLLDNRRTEAGTRFEAISELFDQWTFRHLEALGAGPGMRCWEVGAGGPSIPAWLGARAGEHGRVLATDIDVSWTRPAAGGAVEVRRHDIVADPPPAETFDLVHARLVLVHLADRDRALRTMVDALRPGGVLLVEDADPALQPLACLDEHGPEQRLANRLRHDFRALLADRGADLAYGRTLPRLLREAGLDGVRADAYFPITSPACGVLEAATIRHVRDELIAAGHATPDEIDRHLDAIAGGRLDITLAPLISAWGRKP
ncbi:methyltransferase domain-containing protein [Actinomadura nitritigenes]|uniref:Methyltransferase domain-containing protein n=1 Tax=Actinomadura nitritigenes TaxID=134602 RepID=A0ABS3RBS3_9ACTN|nr:methyltransferase domain-containing protein [Actinomadura nitritigenes]MBO2443661.1 methyltransferase domain-containing protein [Actinomadura nitritigenes]